MQDGFDRLEECVEAAARYEPWVPLHGYDMTALTGRLIASTIEPVLASLRRRDAGTAESLAAARGLLREVPSFAALAAAPGSGAPYGRRVLVEHPHDEVMLAAWSPASTSAVHDHGGARGVVFVLSGRFEERRYGFDGVHLERTESRPCTVGDRIDVSPELLHSMHAFEAGLTLHFYIGGGGPFRMHDESTRTTWTVRGGGAWIGSQKPVSVTPWGHASGARGDRP